MYSEGEEETESEKEENQSQESEEEETDLESEESEETNLESEKTEKTEETVLEEKVVKKSEDDMTSSKFSTDPSTQFDTFSIKMNFPKNSKDIYAGFLESFNTESQSKEFFRKNLVLGIHCGAGSV